MKNFAQGYNSSLDVIRRRVVDSGKPDDAAIGVDPQTLEHPYRVVMARTCLNTAAHELVGDRFRLHSEWRERNRRTTMKDLRFNRLRSEHSNIIATGKCIE